MDEYRSPVNLGPLEPLLADPAVSEIFVDAPDRIAIVRAGALVDVDARFDDVQHLEQVIRAIAEPLGRRFDESHPLLEARLQDGSRVTAVGLPIAIEGPALVLSKARKNTLGADDLLRLGAWSEAMLALLRASVVGRASILVSGEAGAGKTTILNALCALIPAEERIITVEEAGELALRQRRVVRLETRPANLEGRGAVTQRELVLQALRMYPERLVVGDLRGGEAWPLIQAINGGHHGCLATIQASSPRDALARLELLAAGSDPGVPLGGVREQIAGALNLVLQVSRGPDGARRVTQIAEAQRLERDVIVLRELFVYAEGPGGAGQFRATGEQPAMLGLLRQRGVELPADLFRVS